MSRIAATSCSSFALSKSTLRWQAAHAALLGLLLGGPLLAAEESVKEDPAAREALVLEPTVITAEAAATSPASADVDLGGRGQPGHADR